MALSVSDKLIASDCAIVIRASRHVISGTLAGVQARSWGLYGFLRHFCVFTRHMWWVVALGRARCGALISYLAHEASGMRASWLRSVGSPIDRAGVLSLTDHLCGAVGVYKWANGFSYLTQLLPTSQHVFSYSYSLHRS
jgi:hypothetical protein